MKVSNKKVISTLMVILMVPIVSLPCTASASNINNDAQLSPGGLAGKYLAVSTQLSPTGTEIKTINNVDVLRNKLYASNANLSDVEVAKLLYKYMGESENVIDTMPREKLLEALTFTGCVQTTNYIRYKQDGSRELLSRIAVLQDLEGVSGLTTAGIKLLAGSKTANADGSLASMNLLKENAKLFSAGVLSSQNANTVTTSNDGYM